MESMNQLRDLLKHEIKDLYSAEKQIIDALPKMIEKATNPKLKKALEDHLQVTEGQKERLDEVLELLSENENESDNSGGFLGLFKNNEKCKAVEGLITEGEKLMKEDMSAPVMDAAIIAAAQKIEHYEIASYGTVRTYAEELKLKQVEKLLSQTLNEEYEADDLLTQLAMGHINEKAAGGEARSGGRSGNRKISESEKSAGKKSTATVSGSRTSSGKVPARKTSSKNKSNGKGKPAGRSSSRGRS